MASKRFALNPADLDEHFVRDKSSCVSQQENVAEVPCVDSYYVTFFVLVMLGALSIPFCAIAASPHFLVSYYSCFNITDITYTAFWNNAASIVSCIYFALNVPFQAVAIRHKETHRNAQIVLSFTGIAIGIAIIPVTPVVFPSASEVAAIAVLIAVAAWTSLCAAFAQSTTFGIAATFPTVYSVSVPVGIGVSGFVAALLRLVAALAVRNPSAALLLDEAYIFFALVVLANLAAAAGTNAFLTKTNFARHYYVASRTGSNLPSPLTSTQLLDGVDTERMALTAAVTGEALSPMNKVPPFPPPTPSIVSSIRDMLFINFIIMVGSYSMYPGVAARDVNNSRLWGVIVFMAFNVGSAFGRIACIFMPLPRDLLRVRKALLVISLFRLPIIIVPCLIGLYTTALGDGHAVATVVQLFSGLTNGFGSALAYLTTTALCTIDSNPIALRYMTVAMSCGLAVGGLFGLVFCMTAT